MGEEKETAALGGILRNQKMERLKKVDDMAFTVDDQLIGQAGDEAAGVVALLCRSENGPPHALGGAVLCNRKSPVATDASSAEASSPSRKEGQEKRSVYFRDELVPLFLRGPMAKKGDLDPQKGTSISKTGAGSKKDLGARARAGVI